jgi:hypothetical protein
LHCFRLLWGKWYSRNRGPEVGQEGDFNRIERGVRGDDPEALQGQPGAGDMRKRKWCYCQPPETYEISCDLCNGSNITWSEYEHMIWCYDCQKDTLGNGGIFDGPIPLEVTKILGISFDRIEIPSGKLLEMKQTKEGKLYWRKRKGLGI